MESSELERRFMHKTIEKDGKKMVHLNVGKDYYVLLHDWPLSTVWNLNGSLDPVMNQVYGRGYVSMEVFFHGGY